MILFFFFFNSTRLKSATAEQLLDALGHPSRRNGAPQEENRLGTAAALPRWMSLVGSWKPPWRRGTQSAQGSCQHCLLPGATCTVDLLWWHGQSCQGWMLKHCTQQKQHVVFVLEGMAFVSYTLSLSCADQCSLLSAACCLLYHLLSLQLQGQTPKRPGGIEKWVALQAQKASSEYVVYLKTSK